MAGTDYAAWSGFYVALLDAAGVPAGGAVAECACGTGSLTVRLAKRYRVTGVDVSGDMLSVAARKAREEGLGIPFVRQDMRKLHLHRPQDAVLCTCDGVNYLTAPAGLRQFLGAARAALRPGGALAFDLSSLYKLRHTLASNTFVSTAGDMSYIWRNQWLEKSRRARLDLTVFARRPDGAYDRVMEKQLQRAYAAGEVRKALAEAGFTEVRVFGDRRLDAPRPREQRLHFLALRPLEG